MKNKIIVIEFISILVVLLVMNVLKEDDKISISERRQLAQFPKITATAMLDSSTSEKIEKYVTDQFIERDLFRKIKYWYSINILKQLDDNKLYISNGSIYKMEYPLNESAVEKTTQKIKNVYERYLQGMNVYYCIIPDKNYFLNDNHLKIDCLRLEEIMQKDLGGLKYIDIKDTLDESCFYRTDLHWKQENIINVVNKIEEATGNSQNKEEYVEKEIGNFYGVYYGQVASYIEPDKITVLTNETIENSKTFNYETQKNGNVYDLEKYNDSLDKYDVFVSGATPLISIENPSSITDKELLLFRDSFGSSLAPLLIKDYKKITLIDLRYMKSDILEKFIKFENQDVLFIYSSTVLNQNILK